MSENRTGKCLCGAVTYTTTLKSNDVSACHCGMCLRWSGGPFMSVTADEVTFGGEENITTFTSSAWAERGFCNKCGGNLFYRVTADGPHKGIVALLFGTLEDKSGLELKKEWFIDLKPELYTLEGERETLTEKQVMALFGGG